MVFFMRILLVMQKVIFFAGEYFGQLLQYIQLTSNCKIRENKGKLSIMFKDVGSIEKAQNILHTMKDNLIKGEDDERRL